MPYVHLANGDVLTVDQKELDELTANSAPGTVHKNGTQHKVIGVYPDDVEIEQTEDEKAKDAENRQFAEWKASRDERDGE